VISKTQPNSTVGSTTYRFLKPVQHGEIADSHFSQYWPTGNK